MTIMQKRGMRGQKGKIELAKFLFCLKSMALVLTIWPS
jgi:hypothetical protein